MLKLQCFNHHLIPVALEIILVINSGQYPSTLQPAACGISGCRTLKLAANLSTTFLLDWTHPNQRVFDALHARLPGPPKSALMRLVMFWGVISFSEIAGFSKGFGIGSQWNLARRFVFQWDILRRVPHTKRIQFLKEALLKFGLLGWNISTFRSFCSNDLGVFNFAKGCSPGTAPSSCRIKAAYVQRSSSWRLVMNLKKLQWSARKRVRFRRKNQ